MATTSTMLYIRVSAETLLDIAYVAGSRFVINDKSALAVTVESFLEEMVAYARYGNEAKKELQKRALRQAMLEGKLTGLDLKKKELTKGDILRKEKKE